MAEAKDKAIWSDSSWDHAWVITHYLEVTFVFLMAATQTAAVAVTLGGLPRTTLT
jgi:hypothetical protein